MNRLRGYTLLYAEDEAKIRESYLSFLSKYFKKIYGAADGAEALQIYREERPDILISDILLPKIDGLTLVRKIRKDDDRTRVIMLTAYSDREKLLKATELNITKYLIKPVRRDALLEALYRAAEQLEKIDPPLLHLAQSFIFDRGENILTYRGRPVNLSGNERLFMSLLAQNRSGYIGLQRVSELFYILYDKQMSINAIKSLIKRLRKKLPAKLIESRLGMGYRLLSKEDVMKMTPT